MERSLPPLTRERTGDPLSFQQARIWSDGAIGPVQVTARIDGTPDPSALGRAATEVLRRHEVLRTVVGEMGGRLHQRVLPVTPVTLRIGDDPGTPPVSVTPGGPPPVHWALVRRAPQAHDLVVTAHPAILDERSAGLLLQEMAAGTLPEPPLQYRDYAAWQREAIGSAAMRAKLARLRRRLADLPAPLDLPVRHTAPGAEAGRTTLHAALPAVPPERREDLFATALAAFMSLLHRYTGVTELCAASTCANREVPGTEKMLGRFADTVLLRCDLGGDPPFEELTGRVRAAVREAREDQEFPFAELARVLNRRAAVRGPLTRVTFDLAAPLPAPVDLAGSPVTAVKISGPAADTDLAVVIGDDGHSLDLTYDQAQFDDATMRHLLAAYLVHLGAALADPRARLSALPLVDDRQRERVRARTPVSEPLVHVAVERRARETPVAVALRDGDRALTYGELDEHATRLAARLSELGTRLDQVVGVLLPRGIDLAVAELGVLKAGAAYLPLDPDHPDERLAYLCQDAGVAHVVTAGGHTARVPRGRTAVPLESLPPAPVTPRVSRALPHNLAYVMYTSGSTGRPKGVMIEHAALAGFVGWYRREYGLTAADRQSMLNAPGFDASVIDLWPALAAGAGVHVADQDTRLSPRRLQEWLLDQRITIAFLTTALAEPLLELPWPAATELRWLQTGGEVFRRRPDPGLPFAVALAYGPTETTVVATAGVVLPAAAGGPPDIGRPLPMTSAYVLDERLRPVPPGARGELYLGGTALARGYLNDPARTAARFIRNPFGGEPAARLYRTGDLVRMLPDGRLDFLGRTDEQIKLRGNRIEPGEIEAALCRHPAIGRAHVAVRQDGPDGDKRLVGYVVARPGLPVPPPGELRAHLERDLPRFMVPAAWVPLDRLPLTPNGKVDASALPAPAQPGEERPAEPPATPTERVVAEIWSEVLGRPQVSVGESFFDVGGHSMLLYKVRDRLLERMGRSPAIVEFFRYPTVRALALRLDGADPAAVPETAEGRRDGLDRLAARRAQRSGAEGQR